MINILRKWANKIGWDIKKHPDYFIRKRLALIKQQKINLIIDVGANVGQYGSEMREFGYKDEIISFEPLTSAFSELSIKCQSDQNWTPINMGLGKKEEELTINISKNSFSSSFLGIADVHLDAAPDSKYVDKQLVSTTTLDKFLDIKKSENLEKNIFLKIDTQGFEMNVLLGSLNWLRHISVIQLEMSLDEVYKESSSFIELYSFLTEKGFIPYSFESGFYDKTTGRVLQMDGIFVNKKHI